MTDTPRKPQLRCRYGIDTCDGPSGSSFFICNECADDAEWEKRNGIGGPVCETIEPYDVSAHDDKAESKRAPTMKVRPR